MLESRSDYPRTGFVLPEAGDFQVAELVQYGVDAVDAGFESVWAEETWNYDPFGILGQVAARTDVPLGTCIANAYARSPGALVMSIATLQEATGGRFILGLGASTPPVVNGFHGTAYESPLRRLRELVEIVELALSGQRINYDGNVFELAGFKLDSNAGPPPAFNAALGEQNLALTVEHMDGLIPHLFPISEIRERLTAVQDSLDIDRLPHVAPSIPTSVAEDAEQARNALSEHIAAYVGPVEYYNAAVAANGFAEEAEAIAEAWETGDRAAATAHVTDDLVDAVGIAGTPDYARERLHELLDGPVDTALISFPDGVTGSMVASTIDALGPQR